MKEVNIGIVGFGTVGAGVVENIYKNLDLLVERAGVVPVIKKIADLDITSDRGVEVDSSILTTDVNEVLNGEDIDIVVELIGGTTFAKTVIETALKNGKSVVTANKALLAESVKDLFETAEANGVDLYYEASVGGGIPCIKTLREGLISNNINTIMGILNGTCNYIFTRMEREKIPFEVILPQAQAAGYAEAEPSLDVDGFDTAHKTVILASWATGTNYTLDNVYIEGIRNVALEDVSIAAEIGYRIKLIATIKQTEKGMSLCVQPTMIPAASMLGCVNEVFNAVWFNGDTVGDVMMYGPGAGRAATASAVVADIMDIAKNIDNGCCGRIPAFKTSANPVAPLAIDQNEATFYLRAPESQAADVKAALAENGVKVKEERTMHGSAILFTTPIVYSQLSELKTSFKDLIAIRLELLSS